MSLADEHFFPCCRIEVTLREAWIWESLDCDSKKILCTIYFCMKIYMYMYVGTPHECHLAILDPFETCSTESNDDDDIYCLENKRVTSELT